MKPRSIAVALAALAGCCSAAGVRAQPGVATAEPQVQRTVIEDGGARIEELRVRGQLQRVVVTPRGGAKSYEIVVGSGGQPAPDGSGTPRGAAGQRVWHVLSF